MKTVDCGFTDDSDRSGSDHLISYGPTLWVKVGFDPSHRPDLVPALPPNPIAALVDTGATESCIDINLALSLDLPFLGEEDCGGVSGTQKHPVYLAQIFVELLGFSIYGRFTGANLSGGGFLHRVLIGRSSLRGCRMIYDGRTGSVIIENDQATRSL